MITAFTQSSPTILTKVMIDRFFLCSKSEIVTENWVKTCLRVGTVTDSSI